MQIREQDLTFAQHLTFNRLRLFYLYDHICDGKNASGGWGDGRTYFDIIGICESCAFACGGFNSDAMAMRNGFASTVWREGDTKFLWLDFLGATNMHDVSPSPSTQLLLGATQFLMERYCVLAQSFVEDREK